MSYAMLEWNPAPVLRAPSIPAETWEVHKEELCRLYKTMKLDELMLFMRNKHNFTPSRHQYAIQFQRWNIHKYGKRREYDTSTSTKGSGGARCSETPSRTPKGVARTSAFYSESGSDVSPSYDTSTAASDHSTTSTPKSLSRLKRDAEDSSLAVGFSKRRKTANQLDNTNLGGLDPNLTPRFSYLTKASLPVAVLIDAKHPSSHLVPVEIGDIDSSDEEDTAASSLERRHSCPHGRATRQNSPISPAGQNSCFDSQCFINPFADEVPEDPFATGDGGNLSNKLEDLRPVKFSNPKSADAGTRFGKLGCDDSAQFEQLCDGQGLIDPFADNTSEDPYIEKDKSEPSDDPKDLVTNMPPETISVEPEKWTFDAFVDGRQSPENEPYRFSCAKLSEGESLKDPYYEESPELPGSSRTSKCFLTEEEYAFHEGLREGLRKSFLTSCTGHEDKELPSSRAACLSTVSQPPSIHLRGQESIGAATGSTAKTAAISATDLLRYAQCGTNLDDFNESHLDDMRHAADFFYSARSFEDAFVIYLLIYKCSKALTKMFPEKMTRNLIDLARSSTTHSQDEILRHLLSQALQSSQVTCEAIRPGNFLLHAFLASTCRKQNDHHAAEFHRTCALQAFDLQSHVHKVLSKEWRQFALVAYKQLNLLLNSESLLMSAETLTVKVLCAIQASKPGSEHIQFLRSLLHWCMQALTGSEMDQGCWRNLEDTSEQNREIETTAIFCHLWQQWKLWTTERTSPACRLRDRANDFEQDLGVTTSECLAAVAAMAVESYSTSLEWAQKLDHQFYEANLSVKAKDGISKMLQQPNLDLAYAFASAIIAQAPASTAIATPQTTTLEKLRREYVRTFSAQNLTLELPHLEYDESLLPPEDPVPIPSFQEGSQLFAGPPLNPSMNTASSGLASMKLLHERIRNNIVYTVDTALADLPSAAMRNNPAVDFDFEQVMGIAQRSLQSMSIGSDIVSQMAHDRESNFRTSIAPSLINLVR